MARRAPRAVPAGPTGDTEFNAMLPAMRADARAEKSTPARDAAFLGILEEMRRRRLATWPDHFARQILGFKSKGALRGYAETCRAVNAYGRRMAPHKMRGTPAVAGVVRTAAQAAAAAVSASDLDALRRDSDALRSSLAVAEAALAAERESHARTARSLAVARSMVDALDDYVAGGLTGGSVPRAQDVERRLHDAAAAVLGAPARPPLPAPGQPVGIPADLRLVP